MQAANLLTDSLVLMILGMGTVFVFLTVLVIVTLCMSSLVRRFNSTEEITTSTDAGDGDDNPLLVAVISAAIHQYRSKRK